MHASTTRTLLPIVLTKTKSKESKDMAIERYMCLIAYFTYSTDNFSNLSNFIFTYDKASKLEASNFYIL